MSQNSGPDLLRTQRFAETAGRITITLHGSLAFTGKGHCTDRAIALGLLGFLPADIDIEEAERGLESLHQSHVLVPEGLPKIGFAPVADILFDYGSPLRGHANGVVFASREARQLFVESVEESHMGVIEL